MIAFYGLNGRRLTLTNDQAYDLVMSVASEELDTVDGIAAILHPPPAPATEAAERPTPSHSPEPPANVRAARNLQPRLFYTATMPTATSAAVDYSMIGVV